MEHSINPILNKPKPAPKAAPPPQPAKEAKNEQPGDGPQAGNAETVPDFTMD